VHPTLFGENSPFLSALLVFNLWFANWFVSLVFQVHDVGTSYFGHFARTADIAADFILMVVPIMEAAILILLC